MAKSIVLTASGAIKAAPGQLFKVNITKVATGAGSVIIYDNPSAASGTVLFNGDGLAQASFILDDGAGTGVKSATGLYCALAGTTNATVVVSYD